MREVGVWIDHQRAKVLSASGEVREISLPFPGLLNLVAEAIEDADRIVILGPGVAKYRLWTFLTEQYPRIAQRVVDCEPAESLSDPALRELTREYLREHRSS